MGGGGLELGLPGPLETIQFNRFFPACTSLMKCQDGKDPSCDYLIHVRGMYGN